MSYNFRNAKLRTKTRYFGGNFHLLQAKRNGMRRENGEMWGKMRKGEEEEGNGGAIQYEHSTTINQRFIDVFID